MKRSNVPSCSRAWPRVAIVALVGVAVAGCSNSARFDSGLFASNGQSPPPQDTTTGSIESLPAPRGGIEAQSLPAPSRPANGAQGLSAYRPANSEITGSVAARTAPRPAPAGYWTWDGGSPVTVGYGETIETIGRKYGVPAYAILQTNGISNAAAVKPGQRVVIPRYVSASAPHAPAPRLSPRPSARVAESVHIVQPGEGLIGIAHKHGVSLAALARANKIQPYAKINIGDRLTIPGGRPVAERRRMPPHLAQRRTVAAQKFVSVPVQTARVVRPETQTTESVTRAAEPAGGIPSFRWPVKGRIIAGFGPRPNGAQNDGINLAVPAGTPIKAADNGVVAYAGNELKGYGNLVLIRHPNGFVSAYANASEILVKRGDTIKRGQVIAHAGQTGNVTSPQLHFEIRKGSTPVDPIKYLGGA
jgi:murein DD-endopeptidase MepM/ murein hydrolase activator NlpD